MRKSIVTEKSRIEIERNDEGMGIYLSGDPKEEGGLEYEEASELLGELIDYLTTEVKVVEERKKDDIIPEIKTVPLPEDTPSWIIRECPYIWGGKVISSQDSLKFFQSLYLHLTSKSPGSQMEEVTNLRRALGVKDIIDGILKDLG